ncbi:LysM domain-containing protein [Veillonella sp. CHU594]|uniref:LysM peptidoglycan-binding domain-containing protein n=1 Tax=Veillonella sp. CHU594 TaxID=2490948 RepID=UPI0013DED83C|nr:LysM domain-containing protein [Veillonella sp. CHU594]
MKKAKKRTHIRWDRVIAVAMIPLVLACIYFKAVEEPIEYYDTTVLVQEGDTLWGIAKDAVGEEVDVRDVVRHMILNNNLKDGVIHPGMTLKVKAVKH